MILFPSIKCTFWRGALLAFSIAALTVFSVSAVTIHRSFRTREAGFGFGTGRSGVAYPVDAKIDKAIDEARQKEAEKTKVIIGRCTKVSDGDTIHVVTDGNVKFKVRLDRIDAPEKDQPYGKESTAYLTSLIRGKTVRVEWVKKDQYGRVLGIVYATVPAASRREALANGSVVTTPRREDASGTVDINLHLVATGNAWHYSHFDKTPAYSAAELSAKEKKLGLWAAENPINPYEWRKNKRKM